MFYDSLPWLIFIINSDCLLYGVGTEAAEKKFMILT